MVEDFKIIDGVYFKRCEICFEYFRTKKSHLQRRKTCGKVCDNARRSEMYLGENNPNYNNRGAMNPLFKGGVRINSGGYREIYKPSHPNANLDGYILEHRYVMSLKLGRPLLDKEIVHHIDENKLNNGISNLELMDRATHSKLHNKDYLIIRGHLGRISRMVRKGESV